MRKVLLVALALVAVVVLVFLTGPERGFTDPTLPVIPDPTSTVAGSPGSRTEASLPDGTQFIVTVRPAVPDEWLETTASIVTEVDGESLSAGTLSFFRDVTNTSYHYEEAVYRIPAGGILVVLELDPDILARLGSNADEIVQRAIRGNSESGYPVLRLRAPFRWASDSESPDPMAVRFSSFEVRRGCSELAAACSPEESLQVIWRASEFASAPPLEQPEVRIFRLAP